MRDEPKLDRLLNDVAAKALQATGATGVAIGLGREDAMICYAATGLPFADLGVRINTESGLTAAAIRRQMSQWCSDTESDPRVDIEVCRQLGARSIIVVPVCVRDAVVGVIAIFSANPMLFFTPPQQCEGTGAIGQRGHRNYYGRRYRTAYNPPALTPLENLGQVTGEGKLRKYAMRIYRSIVLALTRRRPWF